GWTGEGLLQCLQRWRVWRGRERGQNLLNPRFQIRFKRYQFIENYFPFSKRSGFVETNNVDAGQTLNRGQLLDQYFMANQRQGCQHEGQRSSQDQTLRNHSHDGGDGA